MAGTAVNYRERDQHRGHLAGLAGRTPAELESGLLYPPQSDILQTEVRTAVRVAEVIFSRGLAGVERPKDLRAFLESKLYKPEYTHLH